jgi:N-methylhydantoinase B
MGIDDPITIRMVVCGVSLPGAQGLLGGYPPSINANVVLRDTNINELLKSGAIPSSMEEIESSVMEVLPAKILTQFFPGDVHIGIVSGGSGYGDPLKRNPELVYLDVARNKVTIKTARDIYGVVLKAGGKAVNIQKTEKLREQIIAERKRNIQKPLKKIKRGKEIDLRNLKFLYPISDFMESRSATKSGKRFIYCCSCRRSICPATVNIREYLTRSKPFTIDHFSTVNRLCIEPTACLFEYYCPSCTAYCQRM